MQDEEDWTPPLTSSLKSLILITSLSYLHSVSFLPLILPVCRLLTKAEEFSQFLYTNAFASIGTFTAVMLCVVLASIEAQRRKASALKRSNTAAAAAAASTSVAAESVSAADGVSVNGTAAEHKDQ